MYLTLPKQLTMVVRSLNDIWGGMNDHGFVPLRPAGITNLAMDDQ
jgi:hypothetical protein